MAPSLAVCSRQFVVTLCLVTMVTAVQDPLTTDLKVRYFTSASLICDHPAVNISRQPGQVAAISWIFPDGSKVSAHSHLDPRRFSMQPPSQNVSLTDEEKVTFAPYNLTVVSVNDDNFGYYTCVVVYRASGIEAIRFGLNIDGADFSELMAQYERNAIVGGVAAAAMLLLVGGACLLLNFRYANRHFPDDELEGEVKSSPSDPEVKVSHSNPGFQSDVELSQVNVSVTTSGDGGKL